MTNVVENLNRLIQLTRILIEQGPIGLREEFSKLLRELLDATDEAELFRNRLDDHHERWRKFPNQRSRKQLDDAQDWVNRMESALYRKVEIAFKIRQIISENEFS